MSRRYKKNGNGVKALGILCKSKKIKMIDDSELKLVEYTKKDVSMSQKVR